MSHSERRCVPCRHAWMTLRGAGDATRDAEFSSHGVAQAPRWRDPFAITQARNRISSRARNESRAKFGPSPLILSLIGRGEEGSGVLPLRLCSGLRLVEAELSRGALE
jgi:hypothetical protein